jgi:quercetin dioxygenase-like cupin family protein
MKKAIPLALASLFFLLGSSAISAQSIVMSPANQEKNKLKVVAVNTHDLESFPYDAGSVKFIVSSVDTDGAWSLVELIEMPGYHTNLHRHNHTSEAFYVLEGVLTVRINDKTVEYPAGSYVLIPPGTAHAQGNRGTVPARLLLTMTPGGFEVSFKDRAELLKTMKPSDPDFRKKRQENAAKGNYDVEFLENWDLKK